MSPTLAGGGGPDCIFELQVDSDDDEDVDLLSCQTIGHVAVHFEQTEMLKVLLWNGLNVQQGSCHLIHYAVMYGNLTAVKALLDHDPSLVHSRQKGSTPMHLVPFMGQRTGTAIPERHIESMVSYLLQHGANLDAPAEGYDGLYPIYSSPGVTPLKCALRFLDNVYFKTDDHGMLTALRVVNVFISMGSRWMQPPPGDDPILHRTWGSQPISGFGFVGIRCQIPRVQ